MKTKKNNLASPKVGNVPIFGSAEEAARGIQQIVSKKQIPAPTPKNETRLPYSPGQKQTLPPAHLLIVLICIIVLGAIYFFYSNKTRQNIAAPTAKTDQDSQAKIKQITGYDWQSFAAGTFNGKTEEKLSALLLFHEEETAIFQSTNFYLHSQKISAEEIKSLNLQKISEDVTGENVQKTTSNLVSITQLLKSKGISEAKTHQNRLKILSDYFKKYQLTDSDIIPQTADTITLDTHPAQNQKDLMKLLLQRFNVFVDSTSP